MRALAIASLAAALAAPVAYGQGDWPAYGYDQSAQRYSPVAQIDTKNVAKLKLAWQYGVDASTNDPNPANRTLTTTESVPIMVGGMLYTPTVHHTIVALKPESGEEIWKYDLGKASGTLRGVTYWPGDKDNPAASAGRNQRRPVDRAERGRRGSWCPDSAHEGMVNLREGVTEKFPEDAVSHEFAGRDLSAT